ncbi:MAG: hypothetical protein ACOCV4_03800 [Myxococcota bacterium]
MGFVTDRIVRAVVRRTVKVDPAECRRVVTEARRTNGGQDRSAAHAIVEHYARKGALQGLVTGVGAVPPFSLAMAFVDTRGMARMRSAMAASVAATARPSFFDGSEWKDEVLQVLTGDPDEVDGGEAAGDMAKRAGRVFVRGFVSKQGRKLTQRMMTRWLARRTARRFFATKLVPVAGGAVGAAWNYLELRNDGRRVLQYYYP